MKVITAFVSIFALSLIFTTSARATTVMTRATPTPTPTATPVIENSPEPFNSFELFWPAVAGKTRQDSFYFVKMWKENVRGWLVFGAPEKANYQVQRATKRMLEAEKLLLEDKKDSATQTVEAANSLLNKTLSTVESTDVSAVAPDMKNRLDNLIKLTDEYTPKTEGALQTQLRENHNLIEKILTSIRK